MIPNKSLPDDIVRTVAAYDPGLACELNPIPKELHTYDLAVYATKHDRVGVLREVLVGVQVSDCQLMELIRVAVRCYSTQSVRFLYGSFRHQIDFDVLYILVSYAIYERHDQIAYFFVEETDIDLEHDGFRLFFAAVDSGNTHLVKTMLDQPRLREPSDHDNYALISAIKKNDMEMVDALVSHPKVDPHEPANEPFYTALELRNPWVARRLYDDYWVRLTLELDECDADDLRILCM